MTLTLTVNFKIKEICKNYLKPFGRYLLTKHVVLENSSWWERWDWFLEVLHESVIWKFKTFFRSIRPQVSVHAVREGISVGCQASPPSVIPQAADLFLFLKADNFRDFLALGLGVTEGGQERDSAWSRPDETDFHFGDVTSHVDWCSLKLNNILRLDKSKAKRRISIYITPMLLFNAIKHLPYNEGCIFSIDFLTIKRYDAK